MSTKSKISKKLKRVKRAKKFMIFLESIVGIVVVLYLAVMFIPGVRTAVVKAAASTALGQKIISLMASDSFNDVVFDKNFKKENIKTNDLKYNYSEEYTNFILFGVDSRHGEVNASNSDSMLIVSVHNTTGEVKMVSVYRDSLLGIYDKEGNLYNYFKVNSAYAGGGPEAAINTMNKNLDLDIKDYVTVNFAGVAKIIDSLGGIKVNLTDDEVAQLNQHLRSTISSTGEYSPGIKHSGKNISLNGLQATTYCRIRKATFYDPKTGEAISNDFGRAARQRFVMTQLIAKAKKAGVAQLQDMVQEVLKGKKKKNRIISTSFSLDEIVNMLPIVMDFELAGSQGFPSSLTTGTISGASYVIPLGVSANVKELHKFLFGEENYEPTEAVNSISNYVEGFTGYGEFSSGLNYKGNTDSGEVEEPTTEKYVPDTDYDDGGDSQYY